MAAHVEKGSLRLPGKLAADPEYTTALTLTKDSAPGSAEVTLRRTRLRDRPARHTSSKPFTEDVIFRLIDSKGTTIDEARIRSRAGEGRREPGKEGPLRVRRRYLSRDGGHGLKARRGDHRGARRPTHRSPAHAQVTGSERSRSHPLVNEDRPEAADDPTRSACARMTAPIPCRPRAPPRRGRARGAGRTRRRPSRVEVATEMRRRASPRESTRPAPCEHDAIEAAAPRPSVWYDDVPMEPGTTPRSPPRPHHGALAVNVAGSRPRAARGARGCGGTRSASPGPARAEDIGEHARGRVEHRRAAGSAYATAHARSAR